MNCFERVLARRFCFVLDGRPLLCRQLIRQGCGKVWGLHFFLFSDSSIHLTLECTSISPGLAIYPSRSVGCFCLKSLLKPEIADLDDYVPSPGAVPQP